MSSLAALGALVGALAAPPPCCGRGPDASLPVLVPDASFAPIPASPDPALQRALEARVLAEPSWRALVRERKLAVGVVDLAAFESPRLGALNPDTMIYAASLPKIAILLGAYQALEDGRLEMTEKLDQDMHSMIRVSNNEAATRVLDCVGYEGIARTLQDPRYRLFDADTGGGLWCGKRYAKEGDRRPDPLCGLVHGATVRQTLRFYHLLAAGRLVSPERSREMLDHLVAPGLFYKFACALSARDPAAALYRKSGSWRVWHADSALVWDTEGRRYIAVALVESPDGERILQGLAVAIEEALDATPAGPALPIAAR